MKREIVRKEFREGYDELDGNVLPSPHIVQTLISFTISALSRVMSLQVPQLPFFIIVCALYVLGIGDGFPGR
jgi:hypothetical protein